MYICIKSLEKSLIILLLLPLQKCLPFSSVSFNVVKAANKQTKTMSFLNYAGILEVFLELVDTPSGHRLQMLIFLNPDRALFQQPSPPVIIN